MQPRNLAARAGRWSATHRKTAIIGWILFVVLATMIGGKVGQQNLESSKMGNGESKRHDMIVDAANYPDEIGERVLIQGKGSIKADSPEVTAAVKDVVNRLGEIKGVSDIESPLTKEDRASTVSKDGRSVLVNFTLPGKAETKEEQEALETAADAPLAAVAAVQKAHPELIVQEHGFASERKALGATERADEAKSQQISMGGTLIILLLVFGAAVAAGVPLLLGISAFVATSGLLGPVSQLAPLHEAVQIVTMLIGLAVGVDYAMFYLRRMVEEQDRGRSPEAALDVAAATSGRAVLISGFTVMAAMAGMFFSGNAIFSSFGIGTILVVGVAMIGSLTFLPAVLSYLGQKGWLEKGRVPYIAKRRAQEQGRVACLERDPDSRTGPSRRLRGARRWPARRALDPGARHAVQGGRHRRHVAQPADHPDARPRRRRFPRRQPAGQRGRQGQGRHHARGPERDQAAARSGDRHRRARRALERDGQSRQDRRDGDAVDQGQGHRRRVEPLARGAA